MKRELKEISRKQCFGCLYFLYYYLNEQGDEKNLKESKFWLQMAADAGFPPGQSNLGQLFYVEKDYVEAAFWLLQAAKQGFPTAQYNLAVMYSKGLGVKQDMERTKYWLQQAANQGYLYAVKGLDTMLN
jgi:TPR repeat protein